MSPTDTTVSTGPCGCFACEKWADCDYCGECSGRDPWAAAANERREQAEWDRAHEGSLADWLYESDLPNDGMHTCPTCGKWENSALPCPTLVETPTYPLHSGYPTYPSSRG